MNIGWLIILAQAIAEPTPPQPEGGSLWDYIESYSLKQGSEEHQQEGLQGVQELPQLVINQTLSNEVRNFIWIQFKHCSTTRSLLT